MDEIRVLEGSSFGPAYPAQRHCTKILGSLLSFIARWILGRAGAISMGVAAEMNCGAGSEISAPTVPVNCLGVGDGSEGGGCRGRHFLRYIDAI